MNSKVDMYYRFTSDEEPTDEQLQVIMREVAEDARRGHEQMEKDIIENIQKEYLKIRTLYPEQK